MGELQSLIGGVDYDAGGRFQTADLALVRPDGTVEVAATGLRFPDGSVTTPDGSTLIVVLCATSTRHADVAGKGAGAIFTVEVDAPHAGRP